jgi:hypothetical protein
VTVSLSPSRSGSRKSGDQADRDLQRDEAAAGKGRGYGRNGSEHDVSLELCSSSAPSSCSSTAASLLQPWSTLQQPLHRPPRRELLEEDEVAAITILMFRLGLRFIFLIWKLFSFNMVKIQIWRLILVVAILGSV